MALHFVQKEIIPDVKGSLRWNKSSNLSSPELAKGVVKSVFICLMFNVAIVSVIFIERNFSFFNFVRFSSPQTEIRALVEGQMLHHKAVASEMGFSFGEDTRILATGGASVNKAILQVISDVFNAPVYMQKTHEAALLGAAYRAKYVLYLSRLPSGQTQTETYFDYVSKFLPHHMQRVCEPSPDCEDIYGKMLERYRDMVTVLKSDETDE